MCVLDVHERWISVILMSGSALRRLSLQCLPILCRLRSDVLLGMRIKPFLPYTSLLLPEMVAELVPKAAACGGLLLTEQSPPAST